MVSLLRPWLQGRQIIVAEAFQSFLVGSPGTPTTVEPMVVIEKLAEELLDCALSGSSIEHSYRCPIIEVGSELAGLVLERPLYN